MTLAEELKKVLFILLCKPPLSSKIIYKIYKKPAPFLNVQQFSYTISS